MYGTCLSYVYLDVLGWLLPVEDEGRSDGWTGGKMVGADNLKSEVPASLMLA